MQAQNLEDPCKLHDALIALGPVLLALSAGTPVFKGLLADTDTRWACFEQSVDDRTEDEIKAGKPSRSRVSTSTHYTACNSTLLLEYQMHDADSNEDICAELEAEGMSSNLARYFAYSLSRDPLYASRQAIEDDNVNGTDVMEGMLANVYQIVRLKPPPDNKTGWRVEFRPMESQLTDSENTAFCVFVVLAARLIIDRKLNLYVPLKDVEESMRNGCQRDAATEGEFVFRSTSVGTQEDETKSKFLMADEIINGTTAQKGGFEGMVPLLKEYVRGIHNMSGQQRGRLEQYLQLVSDRAAGYSQTTASWMRDFIVAHKKYRRDSVVSERICYDLVRECIRRSQDDLP